jgi:nicotinamidase-related amidase
MSTALLLIDVQQSFQHRRYWDDANVPAFLAHTHALVEGAAQRGIPIVRVLHSDGPESADNPFSMASGHVRPLDGLLNFTPALTVHKHRHSALVGTALPQWLHQHGIQRLIVAGIRTEQCCETTSRHASDEGWSVDFVADAMLTFPMTTPSGRILSAADLRERTETVLKDRFVTLCTVSEALTRAGEQA